MSIDTIPSRTNGQTIDQLWFNILQTVLGGDLVPRTSGVATDVAGNLGSLTYTWNQIFIATLNIRANGFKVGITVDPTIAASYGLVVPKQLPASKLPMLVDATGIVYFDVITAAMIASATITGTQVASNIALAGKAVTAGGNNVVVANTNATTSLAIIRAVCSSGGGISSGEGLTNTGSGGAYTLTWSTAFAVAPSVVVSLVNGVAGQISTGPPSVTACTVSTYDNTGGGTARDFSVIVIGQRA